MTAGNVYRIVTGLVLVVIAVKTAIVIDKCNDLATELTEGE